MKRFIQLLALLVLSFTATSCGGSEEPTPDVTPDEETVWSDSYEAVVRYVEKDSVYCTVVAAPSEIYGYYPTKNDMVRIHKNDFAASSPVALQVGETVNFTLRRWSYLPTTIVYEQLNWSCDVVPAVGEKTQVVPQYYGGSIVSYDVASGRAQVRVDEVHSAVDASRYAAGDEVLVDLSATALDEAVAAGNTIMFRLLKVLSQSQASLDVCAVNDVIINPHFAGYVIR